MREEEEGGGKKSSGRCRSVFVGGAGVGEPGVWGNPGLGRSQAGACGGGDQG